MRDIVSTKRDVCVGCNRCAIVCPVGDANITYQDENGDIKVKVDHERCIACGACISACRHGARYFSDDADAFFSDLAAGEDISVIMAPSVRTNFPEWRRLIAYLRELGARGVYDVSSGANINVWAYMKYISERRPRSVITQHCPAVVSYCEKYRPDLMKYLPPIHSPMSCTAIYMKKYMGVSGKIAAISPCIAKTNEFDEIGTIAYNVTFARLEEYMARRGVRLPAEDSDFDLSGDDVGALFPAPGGFKDNIGYLVGDDSIIVNFVDGVEVYANLDEYAEADPNARPQIFEVLNCHHGCNMGSGCRSDATYFKVQAAMNNTRREVARTAERERHAELIRSFDDTLNYEDFLREYSHVAQGARRVSDEEIAAAFELLGKDTLEKQTYDCGACGCESCRDMARKIALNISIPLNCSVKAREDMVEERKRYAELYNKSNRHTGLIYRIGEYLLSMSDDDYASVVSSSLEALCETLEASSVSIWRGVGVNKFERLFSWPPSANAADWQTLSYGDELPSWMELLRAGGHANLIKHVVSDEEWAPFADESTEAILAVPILTKGYFWGFITINDDDRFIYLDDEISITVAAALLIVSSILEKEMTDDLKVAREQALSGTRAKSDFLSRMSHEMRTPMNAIIGMSKIAEGTNDPEKLKYCLSMISTSSAHLLGLINDVLDMSKIEAGKFELDAAPFNLENMLLRVLGIVHDRAESKRQRLDVEISPDLPSNYIGDEMRLSQVLTNLLANAIKFTGEDGTIRVAVKPIGQGDSLSRIRFSVEDNGIGMSPDQVGRLFAAFEQTDQSISRRFGGTGLGLAISKNIVEMMNGAIWVESELGVGSKFIFEVELGREGGAERRAMPRGLNPSDISVLMAEQDPEIRERFNSIVGTFGVKRSFAVSGDGALSALEAAAASGKMYDVVFLDADLPGLEAGEMLRRAVEITGSDSIVVLTPFLGLSAARDMAASCGVSRFISRPLFPSTVLDVINRVLGESDREQQSTPPLPTVDFSDKRILLVEDIDINREVFMALMEGTGANIDAAENGRVAIDMFVAKPDKYDVIIMDVQMPVMNGYEATETIRAMDIERAKTIPIIAMTANAFKEDIEKCLKSGMNDHLTKPIDIESVIDRIKKYTA